MCSDTALLGADGHCRSAHLVHTLLEVPGCPSSIMPIKHGCITGHVHHAVSVSECSTSTASPFPTIPSSAATCQHKGTDTAL